MKPPISQMSRTIANSIENSPKNIAISKGKVDFDTTFGQVVSTLAEEGIVDSDSYPRTLESTATLLNFGRVGLELLDFNELITDRQKDMLRYSAQDFYSASMHNAISYSVGMDIKSKIDKLSGKLSEPLPQMVEQLVGYIEFLSQERAAYPISLRREQIELSRLRESSWVVTAEDFCTFAALFAEGLENIPLSEEFAQKGRWTARDYFEHKLREYTRYEVLEDYYFGEDELDFDGDKAKQILANYYICELDVVSILRGILANTWCATEVYNDTLKGKIRAVIRSLSVTRADRNVFLARYPLAHTIQMDTHEQHENLTPSQEIVDLLISFGEEFGFDAETCHEIERLPFEEAFEAAYSYLTQAGFDADEILANFME